MAPSCHRPQGQQGRPGCLRGRGFLRELAGMDGRGGFSDVGAGGAAGASRRRERAGRPDADWEDCRAAFRPRRRGQRGRRGGRRRETAAAGGRAAGARDAEPAATA